MPSGMAATMRKQMDNENKEGLVLERSPWSKTGFVNVIKVKGGKFQARLQVPGDGRGGQQKRKQCSLPGIFNTAEEAAELLAVIKRDMKAKHEGRLVVPPKQISERKARAKQPAPALQPIVDNPPLPHMPIVATAIPIPIPLFNAPFAAASPLPMQPFGSPCF